MSIYSFTSTASASNPSSPRKTPCLPARIHTARAFDIGDLFIPTASKARSCQTQLHRYGDLKASRRLGWRHLWQDAIHDDVLARPLALNAERYAEEQAMGLHGTGGKQASKPAKVTAAAGSTQRGRPAKASQASQNGGQHSEQMGLGL